MGRLAKALAIRFADAENLPPSDKLPKVSWTDPIMPQIAVRLKISSTKDDGPIKVPPHSFPGLYKPKWYEITKGRKGEKIIVRHRGGRVLDEKQKSDETHRKEQVKGNEKKQKEQANKPEQNKPAEKAPQPEDKDFTAEEDNKLKELKQANTPWREIAQKMHRPQHILKKRFKELNENTKPDKPASTTNRMTNNDITNAFAANDQKKAKKGSQAGQGKAVAKVATIQDEPPKPEPSPRQADGKIQVNTVSINLDSFTLRDWQEILVDENFTIDELCTLAEIVAEGDHESWLSVAARFFDATGRRVHEDDIREKLEQMDRLSQHRT